MPRPAAAGFPQHPGEASTVAVSNKERVGRGLEALSVGMQPFMERDLKAAHGEEDWLKAAYDRQKGDRKPFNWADAGATLNLLLDEWNGVFRNTLSISDRSLAFEVRDARNRWAHGDKFSLEDAHRALDSMTRLGRAMNADGVETLEEMTAELLRQQFNLQSKRDVKRATTAGTPAETLPAWRDVVEPHPDVASGRYQAAEFMADLWQVHLGEATAEYGDPQEFFRRTYLTEGLSRLLTGAARRLTGGGGDPVVDLQTNFGGGKSHSMLALYHLCGDSRAADLPGVDELFKKNDLSAPRNVSRAVLHGVKLQPGQVSNKEDGTLVRTLWGELAWQLGGPEGYEIVRGADETGTSPGDSLRALFKKCGPCLILVDEWVRYAGQLRNDAESPNPLPAGTFDVQFSFAQALTEEVRKSEDALLVVSLPESEGVESGGDRGTVALDRLRNVIGRAEAPWQPANADEGFEIVRRRLFQPLGADAMRQRDAVAKAFREEYARQRREFPADSREPNYEQRLKDAYPIHPELFDLLYERWGSLERFQRTRGVLRLMAGIIHSLWESNDRNLMILPGTIPVADAEVATKLNSYLPESYSAVLRRDVDGAGSLPAAIDGEVTTLGKYHACRRVTRTVFMGSAPTKDGANRGVDEARVKLGCVQPGESVATFGDALRRLTGRATYLYGDAGRYWYSTKPNVNRLAEDRAAAVPDDDIELELTARLKREEQKSRRGPFAAVHVTADPGDVPDEPEVRLVILPPDRPHAGKTDDSDALKSARAVLKSRGKADRQNRNAVVFAAADVRRLEALREAVRRFLAWRSITDEEETLELTKQQARQADNQRTRADADIDGRLGEAYVFVLSPTQVTTAGEVEWDEATVTQSGRSDGLPATAAKKLIRDEALITDFGAATLRHHLDTVPLWRHEYDERHVPVRQLLDDFAKYLYLPRLTTTELILEAAQEGVASLTWEEDAFAYADDYDEAEGRYRNLRGGKVGPIREGGVLVKASVALDQLAAERPSADAVEPGDPTAPNAPTAEGAPPVASPEPTAPVAVRFVAEATLDPLSMATAAEQIQREVVRHLAALPKSKVTVLLEINALLPGGADEKLRRDVSENCTTLKLTSNFSEA